MTALLRVACIAAVLTALPAYAVPVIGPCQMTITTETCLKVPPFTCQPTTGVFDKPNGTACSTSDADLCTDDGAATCQAGECEPPRITCSASDTCHEAGTCDPATGRCSDPPKADGSLCNDGDLCTERDRCIAGQCGGAPVVCNGPTPQCGKAPVCDDKTGLCASPPAPAGTPCDDGNLCTSDDVCDGASQCVGGAARTCSGAPDPASGESKMNAVTVGDQFLPAACRTADGTLVVVWSDMPSAGQGRIVGRRYDADGAPFGDQFQVNTSSDFAGAPDVACAAGGTFVVIWTQRSGAPATGDLDTDVMARRYAGATPLGDPFVVNSDTAGFQGGPNQAAVAGDASGRFVVAWADQRPKGELQNVYARRFAAAGTPLGAQLVVNATAHVASRPDVAVRADGSFAVVWTGVATSDDQADVFARRFAADGAPQGADLVVNTTTAGRQGIGPDAQRQGAAVAALADGGLAVAWTSDVVDSESSDERRSRLRLQRFASDGTKVGGELEVAAELGQTAAAPDVAATADGGALATWASLVIKAEPYVVVRSDVWAQRFSATGAPAGTPFQVNTQSGNGSLLGAVVALDDAGNLVLSGGGPALATTPGGALAVVWESAGVPMLGERPPGDGQDGEGSGIYAQLYRVADGCRDLSACNPATGQCGLPQPDGSVCSDGDACSDGDQCSAGRCVATPRLCPGGDTCHDASTCDPATGTCGAPPAKADGITCSDGNPCTLGDVCQAGTCAAGSPRTCTAPDACQSGACDTTNGACVFTPRADGTACDDANQCTSGDACRAGVCRSGGAVTCAAPGACQQAGVCQPQTGTCTYASRSDGTPCDDANQCTVSDRCAAGRCASGSAVICGGNPGACHESFVCDPQTGACNSPLSPDGSACDDGNACTRGDRCAAGSCGGGADPSCGGRDPFTCWVAAVAPKSRFLAQRLTLHSDEFGVSGNELVVRPQRLCQTAGIDTGPIPAPPQTLGCYDLYAPVFWGPEAAKGTALRTLVNRFGQQTVKVLRMRGATGESLCTPLTSGGATAAALPSHRCYRALPTTAAAPVPIFSLNAALGSGRFRLGTLTQYCTPAGPSFSAPAQVLACYTLSEERPLRAAPPDQPVSGAFGSHTLHLGALGRTLCVPSTVLR